MQILGGDVAGIVEEADEAGKVWRPPGDLTRPAHWARAMHYPEPATRVLAVP